VVSERGEQDQVEALDDDKLPPEYPPEEPLAVDGYGTTLAEERAPEPLAERVRREEPDFGAPAARGADLDADPTVEPDATASERTAAPAEEAAMRVDDDLVDGT
jgi:hypothetical protein